MKENYGSGSKTDKGTVETKTVYVKEKQPLGWWRIVMLVFAGVAAVSFLACACFAGIAAGQIQKIAQQTPTYRTAEGSAPFGNPYDSGSTYGGNSSGSGSTYGNGGTYGGDSYYVQPGYGGGMDYYDDWDGSGQEGVDWFFGDSNSGSGQGSYNGENGNSSGKQDKDAAETPSGNNGSENKSQDSENKSQDSGNNSNGSEGNGNASTGEMDESELQDFFNDLFSVFGGETH